MNSTDVVQSSDITLTKFNLTGEKKRAICVLWLNKVENGVPEVLSGNIVTEFVLMYVVLYQNVSSPWQK